ncbi:Cys-tRNA(Pro) deacylase [Shewanella sp. MEBiC00475]|uniref:Cys-tRNA(Pro) deacylase n=1 Tax=Shewanella sp. MEBiC00475 TaxID=2575361 RepID=UPI0010C00450|nr:Cys-tRNA(Pro) deacylase [Shewanella sp. MEBiC00475]
MTPAIEIAKKHKIDFEVHEYHHDAHCESYGLEAAQKLGLPAQQVFKTLVVSVDNHSLVVGIVPVSSMLSMKSIAKAAGAKKAHMADALAVERSSGYVLGGVSPLGQKKRLLTVIDASAQQYQRIYVSAGKRGVDISLNPMDLQSILNAKFADICAQS